MIYLSIILDFLACNFLPINTYFIITNLDEQKMPKIMIIGLLLDFLYKKILCLTIILLFLHLLIKHTRLLKTHKIIKNIFLFVIFFNLTFFLFGISSNYILSFFLGLSLNIFYLLCVEKLLK